LRGYDRRHEAARIRGFFAEAQEEFVERTDNNDDGVAGPVPESARSSDEIASSDATLDPRVAREEVENDGTTGLPADDPDGGEERKKAYKRGAVLVSRID
jgi:hypothetical protein